MIEIKNAALAQTYGLEWILQSESIEWSIGTGGYGSIIRAPDDASQNDIDTATAIQDVHNTLVVGATKDTILADNADETVLSCAALGLAFDYRIWINGALDSNGAIADGSMEYSTNKAGGHLIEIKNSANYETGYAIITVTEVA